MGRLNKFEQIVKGMKAVIDVPLTAKIRTGVYSDKNTAHTLLPQLRDWGCALTTVSYGLIMWFLAHLSTKCSGGAIVTGHRPSSVRPSVHLSVR